MFTGHGQWTSITMQRNLLNRVKLSIKESEQFHGIVWKKISTGNVTQRSPVIRRRRRRTSHPKDLVSWVTLISDLAQHASSSEMALLEASRMFNSGIKPNGYILVCLIKASTNLGWIFYGQQLHCHTMCSGFNSNLFVSTSLINTYVKAELFDDAHKVFVEIPQPNVVSWNSLICGYVQNGQFRKALSLVVELDRSDLQVDSFTITAALAACTQLGFLDLGQSIHSRITKSGFEWSVVVGNCLIDMYGKCRSAVEAIQAFNEMIDKDLVSWNSVIAAVAGNGLLNEALDFLGKMPSPDTISFNEVINGIVKFGDMEDAIQVLSEMPNPNSSSWNSVITGYVNQDRPREALDFFRKMHSEDDFKMDQFTFSSILRAVAGLSSVVIKWGSVIHCCVIKLGLESIIFVSSALIDMYSKCGQVRNAELVFNCLPVKNLVSWNAMISGYSHNGNSDQVITLFEELKMTKHGLKPDDITFLSVLSSSAACGKDKKQLDRGVQYFESMIKEYGINPTVQHCTCMIRILGLRSELWKAERMIHDLGFGSCGLVWKALLNAAASSLSAAGGGGGDLMVVAEVAAAKVIELDGDDEFVYVVLSNMYASRGRWRDVSIVRGSMRKRGLRKEAGCSWVVVD